jgi:glutamate carboxypeptidase
MKGGDVAMIAALHATGGFEGARIIVITESRGAGDISFVAPYVTGMDGPGVAGHGAHSPEESVNLNSRTMAAERAALLMRRLITGSR